MRENVGTVDAYLRITLGLTVFGLALGTRGRSSPNGLLLMLAAMKVAEGITRWCPVLSALGLSTVEEDRPLAGDREKVPAGHAAEA